MAGSERKFLRAGILFFDLKGYSELDEDELNVYHQQVFPMLYDCLFKKDNEDNFVYKNTWGDGIVLIHQDFDRLAHIALSLRDFFNGQEYLQDHTILLKNKPLEARISMHVGEFLSAVDPFQNRPSFFGKNIIRSARIEPVTPPRSVWVTDELKRDIEDRIKRSNRKPIFAFVDRGERILAKEYGTEKIWELDKEGYRYLKTLPNEDKGKSEGTIQKKNPQISHEKNKRIYEIFGKNFNEVGLPHCTKKIETNGCLSQTDALCLTAELIRNTEAMSETHRFILHIHEMLFIVNRLTELLYKKDYKKEFPGIKQEVDNLRRKIQSIDGFFSELPRKLDDEDKWKQNPQWRLTEFICLRGVQLIPWERDRLIESFKILRDFLSNLSNLPISSEKLIIDELHSSAFTNAINDFYNYATKFNFFINSLAENRKKLTIDSVKIHFNDLGKCITSLPHNNAYLPKIWHQKKEV
jgi:hypothetical protein